VKFLWRSVVAENRRINKNKFILAGFALILVAFSRKMLYFLVVNG
jgi:hypothetical protein